MNGVARPCFWCGLPNFSRGSAPARVADLLESDPDLGWTTRQIADRLALARNTTHRALYRLRDAKVVERWHFIGKEGIWRWLT